MNRKKHDCLNVWNALKICLSLKMYPLLKEMTLNIFNQPTLCWNFKFQSMKWVIQVQYKCIYTKIRWWTYTFWEAYNIRWYNCKHLFTEMKGKNTLCILDIDGHHKCHTLKFLIQINGTDYFLTWISALIFQRMIWKSVYHNFRVQHVKIL